MDICVLSTLAGDGWGGSEELWSAAAKRLVEGDNRVTAVTRARRERPEALTELAARGVNLSTWRPAGRVRRALYKGRLLRGPVISAHTVLVNTASAHDLINASTPRAMVNRARRSGIPYILAPHSLIERRLSPRNRRLLRELYTGAAAVVLPSMRMREDLERQLVVSLPHCVEIPTPTPMLAAPPEPRRTEGRLRMACVARIDIEQKGQDILLSALSSVSWRDKEWTLSVFGTGPDEDYVRSLVHFYGLDAHVTLHGQSRDIAAVWRDHDVLAQPSRREARGIAITEAMAAGRPVIATAVGGIPDSVIDEVTGLLVCAPTHDAWVDGLERLWSSRDRLPAWGTAARTHVERLFEEDPVTRLVALLTSKM